MARIPFNLCRHGTKYKPFADCTPEEIQEIVQAGNAEKAWAIGDKYPFELNGTVGIYTFDHEVWYAEIIGFNHNAELETGGLPSITLQFGVAEDGTKVAFVDDNYSAYGNTEGFIMNPSNTSEGGWESSYVRNTICPAFLEAMSEEWQNIIKPTIKYTDNVGGGSGNVESNVTATEDKIFLLNYYEIRGVSSNYANTYEADYTEPYSDRYSSSDDRIRYKHSATETACAWWVRSAKNNNASSFCFITTSGSQNSSTLASTSYGFAPAFTIF